MFQSRDEVRQVYLNVWRKMQNRLPLETMEAVIAGVIDDHPEYHPILTSGDDAKLREFTPEQGQTNPFLHMGMHITLREQAGSDRPAGIKSIYHRLIVDKGRHEAEHAMMECLGLVLWNAQNDNRPPDETAYIECLKKL